MSLIQQSEAPDEAVPHLKLSNFQINTFHSENHIDLFHGFSLNSTQMLLNALKVVFFHLEIAIFNEDKVILGKKNRVHTLLHQHNREYH